MENEHGGRDLDAESTPPAPLGALAHAPEVVSIRPETLTALVVMASHYLEREGDAWGLWDLASERDEFISQIDAILDEHRSAAIQALQRTHIESGSVAPVLFGIPQEEFHLCLKMWQNSRVGKDIPVEQNGLLLCPILTQPQREAARLFMDGWEYYSEYLFGLVREAAKASLPEECQVIGPKITFGGQKDNNDVFKNPASLKLAWGATSERTLWFRCPFPEATVDDLFKNARELCLLQNTLARPIKDRAASIAVIAQTMREFLAEDSWNDVLFTLDAANSFDKLF